MYMASRLNGTARWAFRLQCAFMISSCARVTSSVNETYPSRL